MNLQAHQAHLEGLFSLYTSTWSLLRHWAALPAGERQHTSIMVQMCTDIYAHPRPKSSLPAEGINAVWISLWERLLDCQERLRFLRTAVFAVVMTGLCDITRDWSFSSDQDNHCGERMREESLPNSAPLSCNSQYSSVCKQGLQLVRREQLIPSLCSGSHQIYFFALYHFP